MPGLILFNSDIAKLSPSRQEQLAKTIELIIKNRKNNGQEARPEYWVVPKSAPFADAVKEAITAGVQKLKEQGVNDCDITPEKIS